MIPSYFPVFDAEAMVLSDGLVTPATTFCNKAIVEKAECTEHYKSLLSKPEGFHQCPFGFTSQNVAVDGRVWIVTGVVAFPRFGTSNEREMAKRFPANKCTRETMNAQLGFVRQLEAARAQAIEEASKVLPQAFHELRKLNGAVLQHAEREIDEHGESRSLLSIKSAAELMRNNFDILEALSNIEGMRALPSDSTINVFDLVFKMKRVLQEKATSRGISVSVTGVRAIVKGSQKSFPIVPAVLLENAIKYGVANRPIRADIAAKKNTVVITVENQSTGFIDPVRCFERGARFAKEVEGGGFGLYLAREIVDIHHGTIRCDAKDGSVRMIVELPLHEVMD
jgi:light-regulated signal transduction histidine kinase (bacteriophytochrome)